MNRTILSLSVLALSITSVLHTAHAQAVSGGLDPFHPCLEVGSQLACGNGSSIPAVDPQGNPSGQVIAIGGTASGNQTIEIGYGSTANYASTVVGMAASGMGLNSANRNGDYTGFAAVFGNGSQGNGYGSTALGGYAAIANSYASTAIGLHATAGTTDANGGNGDIAVGSAATTMVATGDQTSGNIAIGSSAGTVAGGSPAGQSIYGGQTTATGGNAIALGTGAVAAADRSIAIGNLASTSSNQSVVIGSESTTIGKYGATSVGSASLSEGKTHITGQFGSTVGFASNAQGVGDTAIGAYANTGAGNGNASDDSSDSYRTAIGYKSSATGEAAAALGAFNVASGLGSVSLGYGARSTGTTSVALGAGSNDYGRTNVVSVGSVGNERTITNVAAGVNTTDAVNKGQLDGAVAGVTDSIHQSVSSLQTDISNLGTALNDGDHVSAVGIAAAQGTANQALQNSQSNTSAIATTNTQVVANTVQIQALVNGQAGVCTVSNGALSCGTGSSATGAGALAVGTNATASTAGSVALGNGAQAKGDPTVAIGQNAIANGNNSVAIGAGAVANGTNSVALGAGTVAARDNSVDVGGRQITSVAAGTQPTDAVNVSQLNSMQSAGNAYADGAAAKAYGQARSYAASAVAQALAMPSIPQLAEGQKWVGAAAGNYDGKSALGVAFGYQVTAGWNIGGGVSSALSSSDGNKSHLAIKVQTGYAW
jgi:autotransporter adhesin